MSAFSCYLPSFLLQIQFSWWIFKRSVLPGQVLIVYRVCWHLCRFCRIMMRRWSGQYVMNVPTLQESLASFSPLPCDCQLEVYRNFQFFNPPNVIKLIASFLITQFKPRGHLCARRVVRDHFFTSKQFLQQIVHSTERQVTCRLLFTTVVGLLGFLSPSDKPTLDFQIPPSHAMYQYANEYASVTQKYQWMIKLLNFIPNTFIISHLIQPHIHTKTSTPRH